MSIVITTDVFCDGCSQWAHGVVGNSVQATKARVVVARYNGWHRHVIDGKHKDYCPNCHADYLKLKNAHHR